jgi:glycine cleavage system H lipoate-binding protein
VNEALVETPSLVNEDPTGTAWFFKIIAGFMFTTSGVPEDTRREWEWRRASV